MRTKDFPCDDLFINRRSPRAFTGEAISDKQLMTLFEASRWAPSCFNEQPWHIIYAKRDTPQWLVLFGLLTESNQVWCKDTAALFVFVSKETFTRNDKINKTHSYDCGSAWMSLALQAELMGLAAHGMAGFDFEKAKSDLKIPNGYTINAMAAVGVPLLVEKMSQEVRAKEEPTVRKHIKEFIHNGSW